MKNAFVLLTAILFLSACKTTEEKQSISPVSLSEDMKGKVTLNARKNTPSGLDRDKVLIVLNGVKMPKSYDFNVLNPKDIKTMNVYKGHYVKEKFDTIAFESAIEIFTK
jgi:hypothetical protein